MNMYDYFAEAQKDANENFYNAFGMEEMDYDDESFAFEGDDDFSYATGGAVSTSQPYIVNVENTTTDDISNVTILGTYENVQNSAPAYGNTTGISITMGISNLTYKEFLYQSMNKPFVIGLTYLQSSNSSQVLETLTLTQKDANGNQSTKVLVPTVDPYQQQSDKIALKFTYKIDGFTSITISKLLAKSGAVNGNMKLYMYPAENVSTSRTLAGRRAVRGYGDPHVVKSDKLVVSKGAIDALQGGRR